MAPERPLLADLQGDAALLASDLREMFRLRWQLARLELEADAAALKRLVIRASLATVMGLTALPLVGVWAAEMLARWSAIPRTTWLAGFAAVLVLLSLAVGWLAWRRFRREWLALAETLAELREDLVWLDEWTSRTESPKP